MKRIIVIGCGGSGKSTFSRALAKKTDLPLVHLDLLYWQADGTTVDREVFLSRLHEAMSKDEWIIDGNYASTMEERMAACDTVFFLDYPTEVCLDGIRERVGKPRPDMPCKLPEIDDEFLRFVTDYREKSRPQVLALLKKYKDKNIFIFKTREETDAFLSK